MKKTFYLAFLLSLVTGCRYLPSKYSSAKAPEYFQARFETTKGNFDIEAYRKWSPLAVDRLYQLIKSQHFRNIPFYRVIPNFVAQFGAVDSAQKSPWEKRKFIDESAIKPNEKGTISFARDGKETRSTQLFINLKDNSPRLDTINYLEVKGFPVIAVVTTGMEVVNSLYGYGEAPGKKMDSIKNGAYFLKKNYPNMDYITKAYIIKGGR